MKDLFTCFSNLLSLSLGSQSSEVGFDYRLTVGSPSFDCRSAMLKLVSVLVLILTIGVGNVLGAADYTYTLADGDFTTSSHSKTSGGITWTHSHTSGTESYGWDSDWGFKFGSSNSSYPTAFKLTSSSFSNKIKKVVVTANVNSKKSCKLDVKVGSTTYGSQETINTKNDDTWEFSKADASTVNGAVELSFSSNTGPLYLKKIEVYYYSGSSYTLTFKEWDGGGAASGSPSTGSVTANATSFSFGATAPSKTGHTIEGFYTNTSASSGVKVANSSRQFVASVASWTNASSQYTKGANANLYIKWQADEYTISTDLTNISVNTAFPSSVTYTGSATDALDRTLSVTSSYALPSDLTVTMGGNACTKGTEYSYNSSTGAFSFDVAITGDISISGSAIPYRTITFNDNGSTTVETWLEGSSHATPTITGCTGYDPLGWTTTAPTSSAWATEPSYTAGGNNITVPSSNTTYYAVYTTEGTTPINKFKRVTSSSDLISGEKYVITNTAETYALKCDHLYYFNNPIRYFFEGGSVSPSSGIITTTTQALIYTITGDNTDGYSIYSTEDGGTGIGYDTSDETLSWYSNAVKDWLINVGESNNVTIQSKEVTTNYLTYENYSSYYLFWLKASGTVHLFKQMYNTLYIANPTCCTELGYIGGSVEFTDPTTAVLTWNAMSNVDATTPYTITYRTGSDDFDDDNVGSITTNGAGKKTCTITGLSCNTSYDFKIEVTAASNYCDKDTTMTGKNSGTWSVTSTIVNGTKTDVPTTACGDYEAEFAASDGYHFPAKASITVTGASDFSWNSSTGVLSIDGEDITGNISISITCPPDACSDWGFYYGTDKVADWAYECFTKVKPADATDHEWQTDEIALPNKPNWYVDNATEDDGKKKTVTWDDLYFAASQGDGARPMVGTATGATGKIRIYDNWDWNNRAAGFLPTGYVLKFGSNEYAFDFVASNEYRTGIINLNSTTYADAVSVGVEDGNGDYVSTGNTQALRHIFFVPSAAWKTGSAKFCIHYWDGGSLNARSDYMSAVPGKSGWYEGWLPAAATGFQFERQNPAGDSPTEGNRWTAGENQTLQSNKNCYTMTASGGESDWDGTVTTSLYTSKGKFRMWDNSTSKNWYVTFYPHYVLHYDANSGSGAPDDQSVALDASPCQLTVSTTEPTRDGYTFLGWNTSSSATTPDGDWDGGDTHAMTGDVTLYAVWAANHTLTYNYNGGDGSSCSGGTKYTGESFTACSSAGSKTGYSFTGWKDGSGNDYTAGSSYTMPNSDLTLTAQWSVNSYKVTLTTNGGTINAGNVTSYTYGVGATLPTNVTRDGYRFDGWFTDDGVWSDQVTAISTTATGDKTYYAKWTAIYTVTWHVNGEEWTDGVVTGNSQVVSGEKISTMPDAPDNDLLINCANNFMGWSTQNAGTTPKTTSYYNDLFTTVSGSPEITGNTDFYAVYAELTPSITSWAAGSYYMIETYNNHYYALTGDVSSSAVTATDVTDAVTYNSDLGTITLNPSHSSVLPTMIYTLALSEGVYSITTSTSGCIKSGSTASLTGCSGTNVWNQLDKDDADATRRFGFVCTGQTRTILYNSSNGFKNFATSNRGSSSYGTGYFYLVPTTASNYVTQCASTQVRVNYVGNGGSAPSCSSGVTTKSDSYTICSTEPTKSYYDFKGWNDGTNTYDAGDSYDLQDNTTFTAQWSATKYDITYELDGGTNHGDNPAKYTIEDEDIVLGEPTKDHYRFDGWYQTYSAGVFSNPITTISSGSHGNITVYAKWVAAYVITWDNPMGASVASTMVDQGSALGDLPVPSGSCTVGGVTYSNFVGWYTGTISGLGSAASDAGTQVTSATIPTGDVTYHAVYTNKPDYSSTQTSNVQLPAENPTNCVLMHIKVSSTAGAPTYQAVKMGTNGSKTGNSFTITVPIGTTSLVLHGVGWKDKTANVLISGADGVTITPSAKQQLTAHGNAQGTIDENSVIVFATHDTETFDISGIDAAAKQTITITQVDERIIVWGINAVVPSGSTAKYITSCCSHLVTLNGGSPSNGTVSFSPSGTIGTCDDDVEVTMTITPASGYQLASFSVATGDGKVAPTSTSPAVVTNNNSSAAQNITLTFEEDSEGAYDVTASFSLMTVTSWTWTMHDGGGAIPDPLNLYVGQSARLDVAYTPSGVDASKKTYTRDKNNTYINWVGSLYSGYSTIEGRASTGDNTTAVTFTHADGPETVVNVKVLPLPLTHFEDLVHGKSFDDVVATLSDNALSATKTTPTSDDWTTPNANSCEENHLHLVGWIREDWPALVAYLAGTGDAPTTTAIVGAGNDGSGNAYFFAPNASINVQTFDGVTFYAVWAEIK